MIERVRRVVMGEPESKKSVFTHVEEVERFGGTYWLVWGWDKIPKLPHHGAEPYVPRSFFPPPGGLRIIAVRMGGPENGAADEESPDAATPPSAIWEAEPAGMYGDPDRPGMHRTDTIDVGVVVSGEVTTEASDGSTVVLGPGDVYIQNGALHNWHANPENPGHVVFMCLGATRGDEN
jgi:hypothetical protein